MAQHADVELPFVAEGGVEARPVEAGGGAEFVERGGREASLAMNTSRTCSNTSLVINPRGRPRGRASFSIFVPFRIIILDGRRAPYFCTTSYINAKAAQPMSHLSHLRRDLFPVDPFCDDLTLQSIPAARPLLHRRIAALLGLWRERVRTREALRK